MEQFVQWSDLPQIDQRIIDVLNVKMKFDKVTRVQKAVVPLFLSNKDVCVKACTGSGKTLAFAIPIIQSIMKLNSSNFNKDEVVVLILAPSRELVIQIANVIQEFEELLNGFGLTYFIGGSKVEYDMQRIKEKGSNIVVGTLGRIFDLLEKQAFTLKKLEILVMDETDKLLEDGHETKLNYILSSLPKQRRTGLFSATMTSQLKNLIRIGMRNPYFVEVKQENKGVFAIKGKENQISIKEFAQIESKEEFKKQIQEISEIPSNLKNYYKIVEDQSQKLLLLLSFLNTIDTSRIIIFFGTCASVDFYMEVLPYFLNEKTRYYKLHGKIDQKRRTKIYNDFKEQNMNDQKHLILLTTDLAARGIDIPEIDWILQFDPPQESDSFVHRIGRTARAGKSGQSLIFLTKNEESYISFLQRKQVQIVEYNKNLTEDKPLQDLKNKVQDEMKQDRDLIDKAQNAFVSYMRYYKEHNLNFIFAFNLLDIGQVANSFFLFKIPRVKEILGKPTKSFIPNNAVNIDNISYKDQNKQKQKQGVQNKRQQKLQQKEEIKQYREEQEKKSKKNLSQSQKKRRKVENDWNEWDDLQKEENLAKKLRTGKISQAKFDELVFNDSDFEDI